jgi:hypothetical protein
VKGFIEGFRCIEAFDMFLIGGWSACGMLAGFVGTLLTAAFHP